MTRLLDLLLLAPDLQARVLELEAVDGAEPMAERTLRAVAHAGTWAEQRAAWRAQSLSQTTTSRVSGDNSPRHARAAGPSAPPRDRRPCARGRLGGGLVPL
ncbi:hypothetical protein DAT35_41360 [Vitiosangium sp. GDMCC 1.1324]|nr:hypothetical protein DAT35_41360 [Vitiosangium sp. GDMCC 1.1324]